VADAGRVIAGTARGVRLVAPGEGTRPLSDRVKQVLFATLEGGSLGSWPVAFLDLFAGSGAAGIEALSRGAGRVLFVERDAAAVSVIRENLRRAASSAAVGERAAMVIKGDVLRVLRAAPPARGGAPFGAALVDPPYGSADMLGALEALGEARLGWLGPDAVVVAKHFWREPPPARIGQLASTRERRFGETMLTFYRREASQPGATPS